jgi:hypothetical protein
MPTTMAGDTFLRGTEVRVWDTLPVSPRRVKNRELGK